jgi:hypothetical protein
MVTRFQDGGFVYPGALFQLTPEEQAAATAHQHRRSAAGWVGPVTGEADSAAESEAVHEDDARSDSDLREAA